jgi:hypothetical protein
MKPYRILLITCVVLAVVLSACGGGGGGGEEGTPGAGGPAGGAAGAAGGWDTVTVLPGSVDAFEAKYFPLGDLRRVDIQTRFPTLEGTAEGAVEMLEGAPFFKFTLKTEDKTYQVEGIPEASHAPDLFASPVINADLEPQAGESVTVMGELLEDRIVANYVAVEGKGVWFYRSYLLNRRVQIEVRPEIADLYDGLPVAVKGVINSTRPQGEFYRFDPNRSIPSQFISEDVLVVGTFRKDPRRPYVEATGIFVKQGEAYMPILE